VPTIKKGFAFTAQELYNQIPDEIWGDSGLDKTQINSLLDSRTAIINPLTVVQESEALLSLQKKLYDLQGGGNCEGSMGGYAENLNKLIELFTNLEEDKVEDMDLDKLRGGLEDLPSIVEPVVDIYKDMNDHLLYLEDKQPLPYPENKEAIERGVKMKKSLTTKIQEGLLSYNDKTRDLLNSVDSLKTKLEGYTSFNRNNVEEIEAVLNSLEGTADKVGEYLCKITKIRCMVSSASGTFTKTASEIGSTVVDIFSKKDEISETVNNLKIGAEASILSSTTSTMNMNLSKKIKSVSLGNINSVVKNISYYGSDFAIPDVDNQNKIRLAIDRATKSTLEEKVTNGGIVSGALSCEWLDVDTKVGQEIAEYFSNTLSTRASCDGESLIDLPDLLNLTLDDFLLQFRLDLDLNKPICKGM
jgi:hypothetical protein